MRWAVYTRRYECAESTLRADLYGVRFVYAWGDACFPEGLEARLEHGPPLTASDLRSLRDFLEKPDEASRTTRRRPHDANRLDGAATAGRRALAAKLFLTWSIDPANRNQRGAPPPDEVKIAARVEAILGPLAKFAGEGRVGVPVEETVALRVDALLTPVSDANGRFLRPLQWHPSNPFYVDTRLRNWLMWCIVRDCGVRVGELLTLRVDDFLTIRGAHCLKVIRQPDSRFETRADAPQAKTLDRAIPIGPHASFALQAYLKERPPLGRVRGGPYLLSSREGKPLSKTSAAAVIAKLSEKAGAAFSWHSLRHAWATEIAREALQAVMRGTAPGTDPAAVQALVVEELRLLGGWTETSSMPMRYARCAFKEYADDRLRARQEARARRILSWNLALRSEDSH
jgi:integrase